MRYKCIFFDLDHTLWDYETNSRETLRDLYGHYELEKRGLESFDDLCRVFKEVTLRLWDLYDRGIIDVDIIRRERFEQVFAACGVSDTPLSATLSHEYHRACPARTALMPHALDTLRYLSARYRLTVITNGFEDTQQVKLNAGNIGGYFDHVVTSQKAGHKKPAREIFEFALRSNGIHPHEAIMVGDNLLTDIGGARNASIDTAFFNPEKLGHNEAVNYEIASLKELCEFL